MILVNSFIYSTKIHRASLLGQTLKEAQVQQMQRERLCWAQGAPPLGGGEIHQPEGKQEIKKAMWRNPKDKSFQEKPDPALQRGQRR